MRGLWKHTWVGVLGLLRLENIDTGYGKIRVIEGLNLNVLRHVGIVGPNGAGKSTLARVIAGLIKPFSGKILLSNHDITHLRPYERVALGLLVVPERGGFFRTLTVKENLVLSLPPGTSEEEAARRIDEIYSLFPVLKVRLGQKAGSLSGGEQRMLALAKAFLTKPRLLVLDEPSVGLAPKVKDQLVEWINNIKKQGILVIVEEQDPYIAYHTVDEMYIMYSGKLAPIDKDEAVEIYVKLLSGSRGL